MVNKSDRARIFMPFDALKGYKEAIKEYVIGNSFKNLKERIANTDLAKVGELLRDLREILEDTIDIGI